MPIPKKKKKKVTTKKAEEQKAKHIPQGDTGGQLEEAQVNNTGESRWRRRHGEHRGTLTSTGRLHTHTRLITDKTQVDAEKGREVRQWEEMSETWHTTSK